MRPKVGDLPDARYERGHVRVGTGVREVSTEDADRVPSFVARLGLEGHLTGNPGLNDSAREQRIVVTDGDEVPIEVGQVQHRAAVVVAERLSQRQATADRRCQY